MIEPASETPTRSATANTLAHLIAAVLPPGDVAALRRLRPGDPSCDAFWRLLAAHLAPHLPPNGPQRDEEERRWAVILQALADMRGLHVPRMSFGRALAQAGIAEQRVVRLLRASDGALADAVRVTAHHLAATATSADHTQLARLVLSDGRPDEETVRRRLARDFYSQLEQTEKETGR